MKPNPCKFLAPALVALRVLLALLAVLLASALPLSAQNTSGGDFTVNSFGAQAGNLTVQGDSSLLGHLGVSGFADFAEGISFGSTLEVPAVSAVELLYSETGSNSTFTLQTRRANTEFLWQDGTVATARKKMALASDNTLRLYHPTSGNATLTLNPNTGDIAFSGGLVFGDGSRMANRSDIRARALYDAAGNPVATVAADGTIKFQNNVTFGTDPNTKLNASNVSALQATLKNLGYSENPVVATVIKKLAIYNAQVNSVVGVGSSIYVAGDFSGTASIGTQSIVSAGEVDSFVAKFDSNGSVQWVRSIGGTSFDSARSVAVDSSGNVLVGGIFQGTTTNLGAANITSAGGVDGYLAKFDPTGAVLWAKPIGGTPWANVGSVSTDSGGNVLVGGNFGGTTTNLGSANMNSAGSQDGYVAKFDPTGAVLWAKPIGGTASDSAASVSVDSGGNVFVGGGFHGTTTNLGSANMNTAGSQDGYVAKFDPTGAVLWAKPIGGTSMDSAASVSTDSGGNVLVGGSFLGTTTNLGSANMISAGSGDGYLAKFDSSGMILDAKALGGASSDQITGAISWGTEIYVWGSVGTRFSIGNTQLPGGRFVVGLPTLNVITPQENPVASLAWGASKATGQGSTALGGYAFAEGANSTALGRGASIGSESFASGQGMASGQGSSAFGSGNASGGNSAAFGSGNASGQGSSAFGSGNASGGNSAAFGSGNASGQFSFAFGSGNASGGNSAAFGEQTIAQAAASLVLGRLNVAQGNATAWVPTDDVFVIGNGNNNIPPFLHRSNALTVSKAGRLRVTGNAEFKGIVRAAPAGDLSMGEFTSGPNPATLDLGLRYPGE